MTFTNVLCPLWERSPCCCVLMNMFFVNIYIIIINSDYQYHLAVTINYTQKYTWIFLSVEPCKGFTLGLWLEPLNCTNNGPAVRLLAQLLINNPGRQGAPLVWHGGVTWHSLSSAHSFNHAQAPSGAGSFFIYSPEACAWLGEAKLMNYTTEPYDLLSIFSLDKFERVIVTSNCWITQPRPAQFISRLLKSCLHNSSYQHCLLKKK